MQWVRFLQDREYKLSLKHLLRLQTQDKELQEHWKKTGGK